MDVYLEIGQKKVFAAALDWPGWCRAGRDEEAALQAVLGYRERYAAAAGSRLPVVNWAAELTVAERLEGNATTDFGAPGAIPDADRQGSSQQQLERWLELLSSCWATFEKVATSAQDENLSSGPRGGGRDLATIRQHVQDAHGSYTRKLGGTDDFDAATWARWRGELPDKGPRGGERWPPRYAIRRAAWHILDHAWEIEDRLGR